MSAITVIILVLYFVINTFVVEGLCVHNVLTNTHSISECTPFTPLAHFNSRQSPPVVLNVYYSAQCDSPFKVDCLFGLNMQCGVCCRSHVDDRVYSGLRPVLCQVLHHWSHCAGSGCPRGLASRCHHLSGLLCQGRPTRPV